MLNCKQECQIVMSNVALQRLTLTTRILNCEVDFDGNITPLKSTGEVELKVNVSLSMFLLSAIC